MLNYGRWIDRPVVGILYWKSRRLENFETMDFLRDGFMPGWVFNRGDEFGIMRSQWKWNGYDWKER